MRIDLKHHANSVGMTIGELSLLLFPGKGKTTRATYIHYLKKGTRLKLLTPERILIVCEACNIPPYVLFNADKKAYLNTLKQAELTRKSELSMINKLKELSQ